jgi:hypothetical protein
MLFGCVCFHKFEFRRSLLYSWMPAGEKDQPIDESASAPF